MYAPARRTVPSVSTQVLPVRAAPGLPPVPIVQSTDTDTESDGGVALVAHVSDLAVYAIESRATTNRKTPRLQQSKLGRSSTLCVRGLDWCDRGFHVEFQTYEELPLQRGRFLGPGVAGGVYETVCKGVRLAWKTKWCPKGITPKQLREIDIMKRLSHQHIVTLMGTYVQGPCLGLLIAPVAVCDLATFMEDIDALRTRLGDGETCSMDNTPMMRRLDELCPDTQGGFNLYHDALARLSSCVGCLIAVISHVHKQRIRHKDVKPHNILLSYKSIWLADFGISSDFSALSSSQSEAVERGTPKYCAPEVASYERSGRPADIFSLGCVFLEIVALLSGVSLFELKDLRPNRDGSFQANLEHKTSWFALLSSRDQQLQHLLCEIESMIDEDAKSRPLAFQLDRHLSIIAQFGGNSARPLHGPCCARERFMGEMERIQDENHDLTLRVLERDAYIDELLRARRSARSPSPSQLPRPPMGQNLSMGHTNASYRSSAL